jgi:hypothetical protein
MNYVIFGILVVASLYVGGTVIAQYVSATGTIWQRLLQAAQGSATILWAKFTILVAALAGWLGEGATYLGDPSIASAIQAALKPEYVAIFTIFVMVVTVWARKRTL